jgi:regulator of cell morphogenesis and NO signaling
MSWAFTKAARSPLSAQTEEQDAMIAAAIPRDPGQLTRYIEDTFHKRHRHDLPLLTYLASKVEHVHADAEEVPDGLAELLERITGELEVHMKKEELIIFPAIRHGGAPGLHFPISVMRSDHDDHGADIARIRALTHNMTPPDDACGSWRRLYAELATFVDELEAHIALENNVLFPQFEVVTENAASP